MPSLCFSWHQLQREFENNLLSLSAVTQPKGKKKEERKGLLQGKKKRSAVMYSEHKVAVYLQNRILQMYSAVSCVNNIFFFHIMSEALLSEGGGASHSKG